MAHARSAPAERRRVTGDGGTTRSVEGRCTTCVPCTTCAVSMSLAHLSSAGVQVHSAQPPRALLHAQMLTIPTLHHKDGEVQRW
eukprot:5114006-Prymnesium_polylepis.1